MLLREPIILDQSIQPGCTHLKGLIVGCAKELLIELIQKKLSWKLIGYVNKKLQAMQKVAMLWVLASVNVGVHVWLGQSM